MNTTSQRNSLVRFTLMQWVKPWAFGLIILSTGMLCATDKEEWVVNRYYKNWAGFKPGTTVVYTETTFNGPGEKTITCKLLQITPAKVVVEVVVVEQDFLGLIESAPVKRTYPAKVKKADVDQVLKVTHAKTGEEDLTCLGKTIRCKTLSGARSLRVHVMKDPRTGKKSPGGIEEEVAQKVWEAESIPGAIVKRTLTTTWNGETMTEITLLLKSYKKVE